MPRVKRCWTDAMAFDRTQDDLNTLKAALQLSGTLDSQLIDDLNQNLFLCSIVRHKAWLSDPSLYLGYVSTTTHRGRSAGQPIEVFNDTWAISALTDSAGKNNCTPVHVQQKRKTYEVWSTSLLPSWWNQWRNPASQWPSDSLIISMQTRHDLWS